MVAFGTRFILARRWSRRSGLGRTGTRAAAPPTKQFVIRFNVQGDCGAVQFHLPDRSPKSGRGVALYLTAARGLNATVPCPSRVARDSCGEVRAIFAKARRTGARRRKFIWGMSDRRNCTDDDAISRTRWRSR
jgi:hypothetical protein